MREILIKPDIHKFTNFEEFAQEFQIGKGDLVLTNEFIYEPFMKASNLDCVYVFQEKFGTGEPTEEMIEELLAYVDQYEFNRVVAIGGGAILDLGKLVALERTGSVHDLYFKKCEVVRNKEIIAIPTTCGTGSEVTNISVAIVKDEAGKVTKLGLVSNILIPDYICLIPDLVKTLPYYPFATASIDALIHAVESYLSPTRATRTSELFGIKAMELILEGFRRIGEDGPDARLDYLDEFVTASLYAGIAFLQAGCATVHALSFPLGGVYLVPHGEANYALFGKVLEKYDEIDPNGKIMDFKELIARILKCDISESLQKLAELEEKIIPLKPLREYGFTEEDIETFADSVLLNQQRLVVNSYIPLSRELIVQIYTELY
ncbi:MAG: 4-hydroxybutyrate dehydrogenase [Christensenellales bacterium]|jgi:4-hydroxybutyrate dehydrogenase